MLEGIIFQKSISFLKAQENPLNFTDMYKNIKIWKCFSCLFSTSFTTAAYGSHQNVFIRLDPLGRPPSVNSGSYATITSLNKYPLESKKSCKIFYYLGFILFSFIKKKGVEKEICREKKLFYRNEGRSMCDFDEGKVFTSDKREFSNMKLTGISFY